MGELLIVLGLFAFTFALFGIYAVARKRQTYYHRMRTERWLEEKELERLRQEVETTHDDCMKLLREFNGPGINVGGRWDGRA